MPKGRGRKASRSTANQFLTKNGRYECTICLNSYRNFKHLKRHSLHHTGEKPYGCEYCDARFGRSDCARRHSRTCSNQPIVRRTHSDLSRQNSALASSFQSDSNENEKLHTATNGPASSTPMRTLRRSTRLHAYEARKAIAKSYAYLSGDGESSSEFSEDEGERKYSSIPSPPKNEKSHTMATGPLKEFEPSTSTHWSTEIMDFDASKDRTSHMPPFWVPEGGFNVLHTLPEDNAGYNRFSGPPPTTHDNSYILTSEMPVYMPMGHSHPATVPTGVNDHMTIYYPRYYGLQEKDTFEKAL